MNNADMPAMPLPNDANGRPYVLDAHMNPSQAIGLTKREQFAMAALQGLVSASTQDGTWAHDAETAASTAVEYADALLKALEESK